MIVQHHTMIIQWFAIFAGTVPHEATTKTVTVTTTPTNCPTSAVVAGQRIVILLVDMAFKFDMYE